MCLSSVSIDIRTESRLVPAFVSTMVLTAFILMLPGAPLKNPNTKYTAPVEGVWHRLFYSIFLMVLSLPVTIITNRYCIQHSCAANK